MNKRKSYDLVLSKSLNNKSPINLIIGDGNNEHSDNIVDAVIDLYGFSLLEDVVIDYGINENLLSSKHNIVVQDSYDISNYHGVQFKESVKIKSLFLSAFSHSNCLSIQYDINWNEANQVKSLFENRWNNAGFVTSNATAVSYFNTETRMTFKLVKWGIAQHLFHNRYAFFWYASSESHNRVIRFYKADNAGINLNIIWNIADFFTNKKNIIWDFAGLPGGCGQSIRPPVIPTNPPKPDIILFKADLILCKPLNNKNPIDLIIGDSCKTTNDYSIPEQGVYIVQNSVEILRTDDNRLIKAFAVDIGSNSKEYLWSGSLSLPFSELEKVADKPEIEININQLKFIVDVNDIDVKKSFNSGVIDIAVSSTTNRLKTIESYDVGHDANSVAIMSAQLSRDDLETGFVFVNKDGEDWMIQSGLIDYSDTTALDVINSIALSVGDVVISHAHKKEIMMKAKYPAGQSVYSVPVGKLFDWSANETESIKYNAIVATGENAGITAVVRKEGTAGEKIAPMIVNKLITTENAARRTAINAIYNTDDYSVNIEAESVLFKEIPMIYPRDIVQVGSDIGWVDDVRISVALDDKALIVRHAMSVEKKVV